jgi:hypothetical protein
MLRIQNDTSSIFEHVSTNGRQAIGRPAPAPSNSSAASHACHLKSLRVSASLRPTDFPQRTQLLRSLRSQLCTLIHSLTYSTRDPGGITRREPRPQDFKTILIPFSDTSPRLCGAGSRRVATPRRRTESQPAADRAQARGSPSRPPAAALALPGAQDPPGHRPKLRPRREASAQKPPAQSTKSP